MEPPALIVFELNRPPTAATPLLRRRCKAATLAGFSAPQAMRSTMFQSVPLFESKFTPD
jgi:hypothetical protein